MGGWRVRWSPAIEKPRRPPKPSPKTTQAAWVVQVPSPPGCVWGQGGGPGRRGGGSQHQGRTPAQFGALLLLSTYGNLRTMGWGFHCSLATTRHPTVQTPACAKSDDAELRAGRSFSFPRPLWGPQSTSSLITLRAPWKVPDSRQGCVVLTAGVIGPFHAAA